MEHFILKFVLRWLNYTSLEIRRGCDYMVVRFITTYAISAYSNPAQEWGVFSKQHYVIKFVSELPQVGGFLLVLRVSPPIKLTATT